MNRGIPTEIVFISEKCIIVFYWLPSQTRQMTWLEHIWVYWLDTVVSASAKH